MKHFQIFSTCYILYNVLNEVLLELSHVQYKISHTK